VSEVQAVVRVAGEAAGFGCFDCFGSGGCFGLVVATPC
jgi:hypothetical protein